MPIIPANVKAVRDTLRAASYSGVLVPVIIIVLVVGEVDDVSVFVFAVTWAFVLVELFIWGADTLSTREAIVVTALAVVETACGSRSRVLVTVGEI